MFYDIDEKSSLSVIRESSFSVLQTANRRPRCNTIPLPLVCFYEERQSLHLSPFRIDEFIAGTARSIVTKIVYDIDSSFYVNPVSEWFCLAYFTHDALAYTRNQNETLVVYVLRIRVWNNARVSIRTACKFVCELVRVTEGSLGTNNYVSTNLRGNGRFPETHDARSSRYVVAMLIGAISIVSIGKRVRAISTLWRTILTRGGTTIFVVTSTAIRPRYDRQKPFFSSTLCRISD